MERNILLIDDNRDNLNITKEIINTYLGDINVFTAMSGAEGIKIVTEHEIDVILLDLNMPEMNGIEVCRRLREMEETQYTPIIFFTGMDTDSAIRSEALAVGGDEFISKPIQVAELIARINAMLRIKRMRDKIEEEKKTAESNLAYMKMLWEFSSEILKISDFYELADRITMSGVSITGASGGFINIYDNIEDKFENVSLFFKDHKKEYVNSFDMLKFAGFTGISSLIVNDLKDYCKKNGIEKGKLPFSNMIIIPLISGKFLFGVLVLFDKKTGFTDSDIMRMETFSNFASGVLYGIYSSQKHLSIYEKRYETLFNLIDIPLFIIDKKGDFIELNDAFAKIVGFKNKYEFNGDNFFDLVADRSDVEFIRKGLDVKKDIKGLNVTLKSKSGTINVILNIEKEETVGGNGYYLKGSIKNLKKMEEKEKEIQFFKRINEFYSITDREFVKLEDESVIYRNCTDILRKIFEFKSVLIGVFDDNSDDYRAISTSFSEDKYIDYTLEKSIIEEIKRGQKNIYAFERFGRGNIIIPLKKSNPQRVIGFISIIYDRKMSNRGAVFDAIISFGDRLVTEMNRFKMVADIDFYSSLIKSLLDVRNPAILIIDRYYKIRLFNKAFIKLFGDSDIGGKHCYEVVHGIDKPVEFCPLISVHDDNGGEREERYFEPMLKKNVSEVISTIRGKEGVVGYILKFKEKPGE